MFDSDNKIFMCMVVYISNSVYISCTHNFITHIYHLDTCCDSENYDLVTYTIIENSDHALPDKYFTFSFSSSSKNIYLFIFSSLSL